ncbi:ATP-binding protein [Leptospira harrisiae]|uniref:histidine kinase n=1 Tax=Leptospira harrisiae TaxID=2023189 RepID=A0A2N0AIR3_9LEPT|nr:ATP-binding protein [Leptospira harrisiae]PJZ84195.1 PAS domain-containing sensor histidine kinase [Leptospira harrisiae]PKA07890.1 PAS domain-containing sensor histidine kinase [Leptospira harrisiae]
MEISEAIDKVLNAKQELEAAWDGNPLPSFVLNNDLKILRCNASATELFHTSFFHLLGKDFVELFWKEEIQEEIRTSLVRRSDKSSYPVILSRLEGSFQILSQSISLDRRVVYIINLDTIRGLENREEEVRLKLALESGQSGVWDFSLRLGKAYFSPEYARMLGFEPEHFPQNFSHWETLVHWEDREQIRSLFENYLNGSIESHDLEIRMFTRSGKTVWVWSRGKVVERDENDLPVRVIGTHIDITERKKTEIRTEAVIKIGQKSSRTESEDKILLLALRYSLQLTESSLGFVRICRDGVTLSESGLYTMRDQSTSVFMPIDSSTTLPRIIRELPLKFNLKENESVELTLYNKRTEYEGIDFKEVELLGTELVHILVRKRTEDLLLASEWNLQSIVECSPNGILILVDGNIQFYNRSSEILLLQNKNQMKNKKVSEVFGFLNGDDPFEFIQSLSNNGFAPDQNVVEKNIILSNGQKKWISFWAIEIIYNGEVSILVYLNDLSKAKDTEIQLLQSEKLATIGQLAAGVAHEINNPMAFISSNLETMKRYHKQVSNIVESVTMVLKKYQMDPAVSKIISDWDRFDLSNVLLDTSDMLEESIDGASRVVDIVRNIKSFAHVNKEESFVLCNLNDVITSAINISHHNIKYDSVVEFSFDKNLPDLPCHPQEIGQVIINLLVNAGHAIEEKKKHGLFPDTQGEKPGKIEIKTSWVSSENNQQFAKIIIKDNGIGIPEDIQSRIFDPFFSTKETGEGTGLGLSISMDIIRKHKGKIDLESVRCEGTTFSISLPTNLED